MATYTLETPRGRRLTIEAQSDADALALADRWDLEDHAVSEAQRIGVSPDLILRQMQVESGGNPKAVSPKGALGPMQLMPATAKELGVDPNDPYQNITGGVTYLKKQMDSFGGDERLALAAYNAGPGAVRKAGGVPKFPETQAYVAKLANRSSPPVQPAQKGPAAPAKPKSDEVLGFAKGVMTPLDNAATWVEGAVGRLPWASGLIPGVGPALAGAKVVDALGRALGMPTAAQAKTSHTQAVAQAKQQGRVPGKIGEFAGNVVGTLPTAMLPGGVIAQGAAAGALLSDAKDVKGVATDAAIGAAGAKVGDIAFRGVGGAVKKALKPKSMTPPQLSAAKDAAYKTVDSLGVQYKAEPFRGLISVIDSEVRASPMYDPLGHSKVNTALAKIRSLDGKAPTFSEVEGLRKFIRGNVIDAADNDAERAVGQVMLRQVDDFLGAMRPSHMVRPGGAMAKFGIGPASSDPAAQLQAAKTARDLARRDFLTQDVQAAVQAAELATGRSGIGGNLENNLRGEMKKLLAANPNLKPDERAALEAAVKGDLTQNALRILGRLSPTSGTLTNFFNLGIGAAIDPSLGIGSAALGFGAKTAADRMARGKVANVLDVIARGGVQPTQPIVTGAVRRAAPVMAGIGAVTAATGAQALTTPTLQAEGWPEGAVMQDGRGRFYDRSGRQVQ